MRPFAPASRTTLKLPPRVPISATARLAVPENAMPPVLSKLVARVPLSASGPRPVRKAAPLMLPLRAWFGPSSNVPLALPMPTAVPPLWTAMVASLAVSCQAVPPMAGTWASVKAPESCAAPICNAPLAPMLKPWAAWVRLTTLPGASVTALAAAPLQFTTWALSTRPPASMTRLIERALLLNWSSA